MELTLINSSLLSVLKRVPFYTMPLPASRHWQTRISSWTKHI